MLSHLLFSLRFPLTVVPVCLPVGLSVKHTELLHSVHSVFLATMWNYKRNFDNCSITYKRKLQRNRFNQSFVNWHVYIYHRYNGIKEDEVNLRRKGNSPKETSSERTWPIARDNEMTPAVLKEFLFTHLVTFCEYDTLGPVQVRNKLLIKSLSPLSWVDCWDTCRGTARWPTGTFPAGPA